MQNVGFSHDMTQFVLASMHLPSGMMYVHMSEESSLLGFRPGLTQMRPKKKDRKLKRWI